MKRNDNQFPESLPEGVDWSWTSESMDERANKMKKRTDDKDGKDNLLKKDTWSTPPF